MHAVARVRNYVAQTPAPGFQALLTNPDGRYEATIGDDVTCFLELTRAYHNYESYTINTAS